VRNISFVFVVLALGACQDTRIHPATAATSACAAYLDCLETLAAKGGPSAAAYRATLDQAKVQYGAACDASPANRSACDQACTQALTACPRTTEGPGPSQDAGTSDESSDETCSDGVDNDGDGYLDCIDYSCARNPSVTVCGSNDMAQESCDDCITRVTSPGHTCHAKYDACGSSVSCQAFIQCVQGCGSASSCIQGCSQSEPSGSMLYGALIGCIDPLCGGSCP
jgi:hypothetical protein